MPFNPSKLIVSVVPIEITNSSFETLSSSIAATLIFSVGSFDKVNKYNSSFNNRSKRTGIFIFFLPIAL